MPRKKRTTNEQGAAMARELAEAGKSASEIAAILREKRMEMPFGNLYYYVKKYGAVKAKEKTASNALTIDVANFISKQRGILSAPFLSTQEKVDLALRNLPVSP